MRTAPVADETRRSHHDRRIEDEHTAVEFKAGRAHDADGRGLAALGEDMKLS